MIVDISENNTPIKQGERPGDAPKTCGCGGKGKCAHKKNNVVHAGEENGKWAQLTLLAVVVIGSAICYFYFS